METVCPICSVKVVHDMLTEKKTLDENKACKAAGEEPLPEEDPSNPVFKPIPEPPRLERFLITNRISNYCNQINGMRSEKFLFTDPLLQISSQISTQRFCSILLCAQSRNSQSGKT